MKERRVLKSALRAYLLGELQIWGRETRDALGGVQIGKRHFDALHHYGPGRYWDDNNQARRATGKECR